MMLALLLAQAAVAPLASVSALQRPPQDWSALPPLHVAAPDPRLSQFVQREVAAGRCAAAVQDAEGWALRVDFAVLVDGAGHPRRAVPRAIGCATVEQYAAGILSAALRDTVQPTDSDAWLRTSLVFAWK